MSEFSLARVIRTLPQSTLQLQRPSVAGRTGGFRDPAGELLSTDFVAHVQPSKPAEIKRIPGGESIESAITIFTQTELKTADDIQGLEADLVDHLIRGRIRRFKIVSAADWSGQGFRKFIGAEVAA